MHHFSIQINLQKLKGKIVLLDFWSIIKKYFTERLRVTKAVLKEYGEDGVVVIGIHEYTDDAETVKKVIENEDIPYSVAVDNKSSIESSLGKTFDIYGYREYRELMWFTVIDKDGNVHQDVSIYSLDKAIKGLLEEGV